MKKIILSSVVCASMMFAANSEYKYEVTPMIGGTYTEGNLNLERNHLNGGIAFGFNQQDSMIDQVELAYIRTAEDAKFTDNNGNSIDRDTGISRVFVNLVKDYEIANNTSLYALVGAGVEFFDDEAFNNEDGLVGNYGAGIKYAITDSIAAKFDVRHLIEADRGDNNLLYNLGLSIPFGKIAKAAPVVAPVVVPTVKPVVKPVAKDSDRDGVIDAKDLCPNTMAGARVDANGCMTLVDLNINFATNSSEITKRYHERVATFAAAMKNNPKLKATIEAHTDSVGSATYNQKLSERRANATVELLKSLNVDGSRLTAIGYGEAKPVANNATAEGRAQNRRVTAVISK